MQDGRQMDHVRRCRLEVEVRQFYPSKQCAMLLIPYHNTISPTHGFEDFQTENNEQLSVLILTVRVKVDSKV